MADIDLKTLTPDTSLPTTGFLFGADSQASTNPSVYSTQTVATTLLGSTSLTGDTLTASAPVLNLTQTWNSGAVTFTGIKFNATSTASATTSRLLDLQLDGQSSLYFQPSKAVSGVAYLTGSGTAVDGGLSVGRNSSHAILFGGNGSTSIYSSNNPIYLQNNYGAGGYLVVYQQLGFNTAISIPAARTLQLGLPDAATALAQTLSVQSVVAGATNNPAGADFTITGSQGLGSGAGGSIIFKVAPAGTPGVSSQNALEAALTIASTKTATFAAGATFGSLIIASGATIRLGNSDGDITLSSGVVYIPATSRLGVGGSTSAFPALKRSTTTMQVRLADDTAFTNIQGKLTTDTNATVGTIIPDKYLVLYDATGTAYRVPVVLN
jgi:hypothetical protein